MKTLVTRAVLLLSLVAGCDRSEPAAPVETEPASALYQSIEDDNGLTVNGLAFNGLAFNGLAFNGLAFNGLSSAAFGDWFQQHPQEADSFMKYLVRCAVPAGQTRIYKRGAATYVWSGSLGLAPGWAGGAAATLAEQQVVSACLGALTNKYARPVTLSLLGTNAQGQSIPVSARELADYPVREGCFFGNLFNGEGLFVGNDQGPLGPNQSSLRACALTGPRACEPLVHVGGCHAVCQHDQTGTAFTRCQRGGVSYLALTTRLRSADIYTCGDSRCQFPETCAKGKEHFTCKSDCGTCD